MDDPISRRSSSLRSSEIREILKLTQKPEIISFAGGLPNPEAFPHTELRKISDNLLREKHEIVLQYGITEGYNELREAILDRMKRYKVDVTLDNIIITTAAQQGLAALGLVILNPGDKIAVCYTTFLGVLTVFSLMESTAVPISLDENGMNVDELENRLEENMKKGTPIKIVYVVPNFQNPTGVTLSEQRRRRLVELAREYNFFIIEDDPYGELRYSGDPIDMVISFDVPKGNEGNTIYIGTFSKTISPGLRVGWAVGPENLLRKMVIAKQALDLCTDVFSQALIAEYLKQGLMDDHNERIRNLYRHKRDVMLENMEKYFPAEATWMRPDGGLYLWVILPKGIDTKELLRKAVEKKVAFIPGHVFTTDIKIQNTLRLNFSCESDENIEEGIKRLGEVTAEELKKPK
ncbi:2-aminoadipate transaminase [subsurface metagenome]